MAPRTRRPPTPEPEPGEHARERIVQAATREFALRGFDGARIDAIARSAGVNKALLYYYFPNKRELYRRLVLEHVETAATALAAAIVPDADDAENLRSILRAAVELFESRPLAPRFILREVLNGWDHLEEPDLFALRRVASPIVTTVERGIARGTFRSVPPILVHFLTVATVSFFFVSRDARTRVSRVVGDPRLAAAGDTFLEFLTETLLRGIAAEPPTPSPGASSGPSREDT
jgi:AcrR family transcriptional regulator